MCGSSIDWFAVRWSTSAASHGWYGRPPGISMPILTLCREKLAVVGGHVRVGGSSLTSSLSGSTPRMTQAGSPVIHTPERSGRPFGSRGVAAVRSTPPLAVRGARGLGYLNHCPLNDPDAPARRIIRIVASSLPMAAILARRAGLSLIALRDAPHRATQYHARPAGSD